jgi:uncharacterized protein (TIGR03382 family)
MNLSRLALVLSLAGGACAVGCALSKEEAAASDPAAQVAMGDTSALLRSTVLFDNCAAAKVGPKHLLLAARCVMGNATFEAGKTVSFRTASEGRNGGNAAGDDAGDAGAAEPMEAGADPGNAAGARQVTIASVEVHSSYAAKCRDDACGLGKIEASDARDIAVLVLAADLETVPTVPVDLDAVGQGDLLFGIASGCSSLNGTPQTASAASTKAVPATTVNHDGSPYKEQPQMTTRLGGAYVVTPGVGWTPTEPRICQTDLGAPLFRGTVAAVAGVTSNITTWQQGNLTPVTIHHTRVDATSKVGTWLEGLGVQTIRSCNQPGAACTKRDYDGGMPEPPKTDDNGTGTTQPGGGEGDAMAPPDGGDAGPRGPGDLPSQGQEEQLPSDPDDSYSGSDEDYGDAAVARKKKKAAEGGCNAAPGQTPGGGIALVVGVAFGLAAVRRRRSS